VEAYQDYRPPIDVTRIVNNLLQTVPDKYLQGLDCVVLLNDASLARRDRKGKIWSRKRKVDRSRILGCYHGGSSSRMAYIDLRVDKLISGIGRIPLRIPSLRNLHFGHTLFHEIGHHISSHNSAGIQGERGRRRGMGGQAQCKLRP
jgi:hypothetical protein